MGGVDSRLLAQELPLRPELKVLGGSVLCQVAGSRLDGVSSDCAPGVRKEVPRASSSRRACRLLLHHCWALVRQRRSRGWGFRAPVHRVGGETTRNGEGVTLPCVQSAESEQSLRRADLGQGST